MAYMSQERKAPIQAAVKAICKRFDIKASMSVHHHSTLCLHLQSGGIDFHTSLARAMKANPHRFMNEPPKPSQSLDINPYSYAENFDGVAREFLIEVVQAMNVGNHNRSDISTDYFDVGWYISITVGRWNKPYEVRSARAFSPSLSQSAGASL